MAGYAFSFAAYAQEKGYTWLIERESYVIESDGRSVGLIEAERKAHDSQAARNGGRIDLTYEAGQQQLEIVEALTIKADGRRVPVTEDKIVDIAPQVSREVAFYTDLRTRSIVFPDLEAGDSIRYVYRLINFGNVWPRYSRNTVWFASSRVKLSERVFDFPSSMHVEVEHHGIGYHVEHLTGRTRHVFTWSNPSPVDGEAGATSDFDWGPRLAISAYGSYTEMGDFYARGHIEAAMVTPEITSLAATIVGAAADHEAEARLIYDWVARNIRYVGVAVGQGKLTPISAGETIRNRYGDCKAQVALLAALLAARGIASEPVLINANIARYVLPDPPVATFNHVILYVPELDRYVDSTWQHASFGVLPWGHYGKPVIHAVASKSRIARVPAEKTTDNFSEVHTIARVSPDGHLSGTTHEMAKGSMAGDLRTYGFDTSPSKAAAQLRHFGSAGTGKWTKTTSDPSVPQVELVGEFELSDKMDLSAGEPLLPPVGLRFTVRPGVALMGAHDKPRRHPFPCHAGRQVETIEVAFPPDVQPSRLPVDKHWKTSNAEYHATYEFSKGTLLVHREFLAHPDEQVCQPETSRALVDLLSNISRDLRSMIIFAASDGSPTSTPK